MGSVQDDHGRYGKNQSNECPLEERKSTRIRLVGLDVVLVAHLGSNVCFRVSCLVNKMKEEGMY